MRLYSYSKTLFTGLIFLSGSFITPAHAGSHGETLFLQNCAICHGSDGNGGMGAQLASEPFLDAASNEYIKQTIRLGRPGRIMPSFYRLSEPDIDSIISFINSWRKTPPRKWPNTKIQGNTESGKELYLNLCASCHGENAEGGKGTGRHFSRPTNLPITAPALNNQGLLNSMPDHMMRYMIQQDRKGSAMPSADQFGLSPQQIDNIVSYIRSFQLKDLTKQALYDKEPASLIVASPYSFDETISNIKRSITGANFVHIRDQQLTDGFDVQPVEGSRQMIIYFCNFNFLYEALKIDPRVGMFLPCRITVTEQDGVVQMMTINPKHLSQLFNNTDLDESCDTMHEVYINILEDASL